MLYMEDAIAATLTLMDAPSESLGIWKAGYNIPCLSFTAKELAEAISLRIEGFSCNYSPDVRQRYADSWPDSIDGSIAHREWDWSPNFDLDEMVDAMISGISRG